MVLGRVCGFDDFGFCWSLRLVVVLPFCLVCNRLVWRWFCGLKPWWFFVVLGGLG